ncbi:MAG: c-type cytochrome [Anaeromyxobacteraceae bacterium]
MSGRAALVVLTLAALACERERRDPDLPASGGPARPQGVAYELSEGKRLYAAMNCVGCHQHGGGGMGPALMDDLWLYGSEPDEVYRSIVEGRPRGMPAFGSRLTERQRRQLVAYVRSLAGLSPKDAAPQRGDHLSTSPPEASRPAAPGGPR